MIIHRVVCMQCKNYYFITTFSDGTSLGECYCNKFRLNLNNPEIRKLYDRYKVWKGLSPHMPLTDAQRYEFEEYILGTKKGRQSQP